MNKVIVVEKEEAGKLRVLVAACFVLHVQVEGIYHTG